MPKRKDIKKVLLIGSGPIMIGQAAEFDFSGSQACRSLSEEGIEVVLVNSNPATIMTDPEMADAVYIEPITPEVVAQIIERERPDGILAGLGGQTGLNITSELAEMGVLEKFNVKILGTPLTAIYDTEDRDRFKHAMEAIGEKVPEVRRLPHRRRSGRRHRQARLTAHHSLRVHARGHRQRRRPHRPGAQAHRRRRPQALPHPPDSRRGEHPRLEGVRVRGHEGRQRHVHHHL